MSLFLEKTWPLWWALAVVIILRWFHVTSGDIEAKIERVPTGTSARDTRDVHELGSHA